MPRKIQVNPGDIYGRLSVINEADRHTEPSGKKCRMIRCLCECGNCVIVKFAHLRSGQTQSCGCLSAELTSKRRKTHGLSSSPELYAWDAMIQRCHNKNNKYYPNYGGRNITVCNLWKNSFYEFYTYMGIRPEGTSIDRIDNNGNYEPGNCRWATMTEQARNTRDQARPDVGVTKYRKRWLAKIGVNYKSVYLGTYATKEEAITARKFAEQKYWNAGAVKS